MLDVFHRQQTPALVADHGGAAHARTCRCRALDAERVECSPAIFDASGTYRSKIPGTQAVWLLAWLPEGILVLPSSADATTELRAALAVEPRHFRANLLLGRILTLQNKADAAIPFLRTAVEVDPKSTEAKTFLEEALKRK